MTAALRFPASLVWPFVLANGTFIAALAGGGHMPPFLETVVAGLILFVLPGIAWVIRRGREDADLVFRVVAGSMGASLIAWAAVALLPGETSRSGVLLAIAALTNLGFIVNRRHDRTSAAGGPSLLVPVLAIAGLFYVQSFAGAAYRIPALEDQDMEVQGTAYAIVHHASPAMVTNRGTTYFFAHPPLLHFLIGMSALVSDDLDSLRFYYDSAQAVEGQPREVLDARFKEDFARFEAHPLLLVTRAPNLWLGVLVLFPLAGLAYRLTDSRVAALGACLVYATLPEVYVRSAYGGYMAISNFLALSALYYYLAAPRPLSGTATADATAGRYPGLVAAFMTGWSNQKSLVVFTAIAVHAVIAGRRAVTAFIIAGGFVAGWALFIAYGWSLAPDQFVQDHFVTHLVDRVQLQSVHILNVPAGEKYPSVLALWLQYLGHMGWIVGVFSLAGFAWSLTRLRGPEGAIALWLAIGGVGFSLVDWRQTKHLAELLPPFVILGASLCTSLAARGRRFQFAILTLAGIAVAWNLWRIAQLMIDFTYLQPYRMW